MRERDPLKHTMQTEINPTRPRPGLCEMERRLETSQRATTRLNIILKAKDNRFST